MKLTAPCDNSACIALERWPDGSLTLSSTSATPAQSTPVTAAEVRRFAEAVQSGYFDELLGGGPESS